MKHQPVYESIVLTVISDDRPGIVKQLSQLVEQHGGNWTESSMLSLAGKFAGILLASVPVETSDALLKDLAALDSQGLQVLAQRTRENENSGEFREFVLELLGQDRPGIVRDITAILTGHGVSVLELETHCQSASMAGGMLFKAHAKLLVPEGVTRQDLREDLEKLANELMVDIELID